MNCSKIDATLQLLVAEELAQMPRFIDIWERAGYMGATEAVAWRERIAIWHRFRPAGARTTTKPLPKDFLPDDQDPFLP